MRDIATQKRKSGHYYQNKAVQDKAEKWVQNKQAKQTEKSMPTSASC